MADTDGCYWDLEQCAWVRYDAALAEVEIPRQPTAAANGAAAVGLEPRREGDVRSG